MPFFYHLPFIVLVGTVCSAILTVGFAWLFRKRNINYVIPFALTFGVVSWVVMIALVNFFGSHIQAAIAVPYVQAALDEESECDGYSYVADTRGFYVESESGYWWASEDRRANCGYNGYSGLWRCYCLP